MGDGNETILGAAGASFTPVSDTRRVTVQVKVCDLQVRPAAPSILGNCTYYYRPLHGEYVDKSGVSTWDAVKAWATRWNPWDDRTTAARLLRNRDRPDSIGKHRRGLVAACQLHDAACWLRA